MFLGQSSYYAMFNVHDHLDFIMIHQKIKDAFKWI